MARDDDWRRANWWDYPADDDTPGVIEEDLNIQEIMKDQGVGAKPQESGIMQMAGDPMLAEEYRKYVFEMEEMGLEPMSFEQFKAQATSGMSQRPQISMEEVVKEFIRERGRKPNSLDELKEFYELRIGTASASPKAGGVEEVIEEDQTNIKLASGGLAHILGV